MKRSVLYILVLMLALATLLSGCGENKESKPAATPTVSPKITAEPTVSPEVTADPGLLPETEMPDPEDGIVTDKDGIIGEEGKNDIPVSENKMETKNGKKKAD